MHTAENGMDHQLNTLIHLDMRLRTLVLRAIIVRWQAGEHEITSHDLYCQLSAAGVCIPAGAMAVVFENLRALKLIGSSIPWNSTAIDLDGDTRISWVHPCLLATADAR